MTFSLFLLTALWATQAPLALTREETALIASLKKGDWMNVFDQSKHVTFLEVNQHYDVLPSDSFGDDALRYDMIVRDVAPTKFDSKDRRWLSKFPEIVGLTRGVERVSAPTRELPLTMRGIGGAFVSNGEWRVHMRRTQGGKLVVDMVAIGYH